MMEGWKDGWMDGWGIMGCLICSFAHETRAHKAHLMQQMCSKVIVSLYKHGLNNDWRPVQTANLKFSFKVSNLKLSSRSFTSLSPCCTSDEQMEKVNK